MKDTGIMENNLREFMGECCEFIGALERDNFYSRIEQFVCEGGNNGNPVDSPIEQALGIALFTVAKMNDLQDADPLDLPNGGYCVAGLTIDPQFEIKPYRVDFRVVFNYPCWKGKEWREEVLVECDSQAFHERTEKERRYEKKRDRFLQKAGYKIFHYTGKEILSSPIKIASEILSFLVPWIHDSESMLSGCDKFNKTSIK
jgi:very-short-patch-repair endonuclease